MVTTLPSRSTAPVFRILAHRRACHDRGMWRATAGKARVTPARLRVVRVEGTLGTLRRHYLMCLPTLKRCRHLDFVSGAECRQRVERGPPSRVPGV